MTEAVLITGGARRVGREIALTLAAAGYDIVLHYRESRKQADDLRAEILRLGRHCELLQGDLTILTEDFASWLQPAFAALPNLKHLVHNASIFERIPYAESRLADFHAHMQLHVTVPYFLTQSFVRLAGSGSITSLIDTHVERSATPYFAYQLSKKALNGLSDMLAAELGPHFRSNAVHPGIVLPSGEAMEEAYMQKVAATNPLRRTATPEEVAQAVRICIMTPSLTGQHLFIDGGQQLTW